MFGSVTACIDLPRSIRQKTVHSLSTVNFRDGS